MQEGERPVVDGEGEGWGGTGVAGEQGTRTGSGAGEGWGGTGFAGEAAQGTGDLPGTSAGWGEGGEQVAEAEKTAAEHDGPGEGWGGTGWSGEPGHARDSSAG